MKQEELEVMQEELCKDLLSKAENDMDVRRGELTVKKLNALANLKKQNNESLRLQLEQQRLFLEERRLNLDEMQTKYSITSDMVRKSEKIQRAIGKTMLGLFPEQDKQVVKIMEAAKKLSDLQS